MVGVVSDFFIVLSVFLPFIGAIFIAIAGERRKNLKEAITVCTAFLTFLLTTILTQRLLNGESPFVKIIRFSNNVDFHLKVDPFGAIFANLSSFLWVFVSIYSIGYMRALKEKRQTRFYAMFATAIGSAIGVAYSGNLLTLYMFYEFLTLSTYPLVAHKETYEAIDAGRKYLAYLLSGAGAVLFGIVGIYLLYGTTDFSPGGFLAKKTDSPFLGILFFSLFFGFGTKAALMPLHEWLPSAMVAPTPVSALLHAVAVVKAGVFCVLRTVFYLFGPNLINMYEIWLISAIFACVTVLFSNILAIYEDNLKRRLAFSTVNNLSLIILGGLLLTPSSVKGALLHMFYHGFMKITLFMCAGAFYVATKKELVSQLHGIGKKMPHIMIPFTIGAMGLIGIPPISGFLSKWYLCKGAIEKNEVIFLFVFLMSALLDAIYFAPIIFRGFFGNGDNEGIKNPTSFSLVLPLVFTGLASILLFLFPDWLFHLHKLSGMVVESVLGG